MRPIPQLTKKQFIRFWTKVDVKGPDDCWEWSGELVKGYGVISIQRKPLYAHRVSFYLANNADPNGFFVCHSCDNPKCVNPAHLWLGTNNDNQQDSILKNRYSHGESSGNVKLTEKNVLKILKSNESGGTLPNNTVSPMTISDIRTGKGWKHLKRPQRELGGPYANSKTGSRGVTLHKAAGRYQAIITIKKKRYYLGLFDTVEEAATAISAKKKELR